MHNFGLFAQLNPAKLHTDGANEPAEPRSEFREFWRFKKLRIGMIFGAVFEGFWGGESAQKIDIANALKPPEAKPQKTNELKAK